MIPIFFNQFWCCNFQQICLFSPHIPFFSLIEILKTATPKKSTLIYKLDRHVYKLNTLFFLLQGFSLKETVNNFGDASGK